MTTPDIRSFRSPSFSHFRRQPCLRLHIFDSHLIYNHHAQNAVDCNERNARCKHSPLSPSPSAPDVFFDHFEALVIGTNDAARHDEHGGAVTALLTDQRFQLVQTDFKATNACFDIRHISLQT
jgi:hypothetical protein